MNALREASANDANVSNKFKIRQRSLQLFGIIIGHSGFLALKFRHIFAAFSLTSCIC